VTVSRAAVDLLVATREETITATAAAIASDVNTVFSALVVNLTTPVSRQPATVEPNTFPCSRGCGRLASLNYTDFMGPRRAALAAEIVCDVCDTDARVRRRAQRSVLRAAADELLAEWPQPRVDDDAALRAWVTAAGIDVVAAELNTTPEEVRRVLNLEVAP
jgi:hypothetical protein